MAAAAAAPSDSRSLACHTQLADEPTLKQQQDMVEIAQKIVDLLGDIASMGG
jgi:hypothetical protein